MNVSNFFRLLYKTAIISYVHFLNFARKIGAWAVRIDPHTHALSLTAKLPDPDERKFSAHIITSPKREKYFCRRKSV